MSLYISNDGVAGGARVQVAPFSTWPASNGLTLVIYVKPINGNTMPDQLLSLCKWAGPAGWFARLRGANIDTDQMPGILTYNDAGTLNHAHNSDTNLTTNVWYAIVGTFTNGSHANPNLRRLRWGEVGGSLVTSLGDATAGAMTITNVDTVFVGNWRSGSADGVVNTTRGYLAHAAIFSTPIINDTIAGEFLAKTPRKVAVDNGLTGNLPVYIPMTADLVADADYGGATYTLAAVGANTSIAAADNPSLLDVGGGGGGAAAALAQYYARLRTFT